MKLPTSLIPILAGAAMAAGCITTETKFKGVGMTIMYNNDALNPIKAYPSMQDCLADGVNVFERVAAARYAADAKAGRPEPLVFQVCAASTTDVQYNRNIAPPYLAR